MNLIAAESVDGRVKDLVPSSAGAGFESPRQHPRSSLRGRLLDCLPGQQSGRGMELTVHVNLVRRRQGRTTDR